MQDMSEHQNMLTKIVATLDSNPTGEVPATIIITGGYDLVGYIIGLDAHKQVLGTLVTPSPTYQSQPGGETAVKNLIERSLKETLAEPGCMSFRTLPDATGHSSLWRIRLSDVAAWSIGHIRLR